MLKSEDTAGIDIMMENECFGEEAGISLVKEMGKKYDGRHHRRFLSDEFNVVKEEKEPTVKEETEQESEPSETSSEEEGDVSPIQHLDHEFYDKCCSEIVITEKIDKGMIIDFVKN